MASEAQVQEQVAEYLVKQYPNVLFHSDFGSGARLTPGQAAKQKRQNGGRSKWPDMFIAHEGLVGAQYGSSELWDAYIEEEGLTNIDSSASVFLTFNGLFLELKKDGTRLKKKNGEWANEHIAEQAEVLAELREHGYCAEFAVGFDEAKKIIDEYLGEK